MNVISASSISLAEKGIIIYAMIINNIYTNDGIYVVAHSGAQRNMNENLFEEHLSKKPSAHWEPNR